MVVEDAEVGQSERFPVPLVRIATCRLRSVWAGITEHDLYALELEGSGSSKADEEQVM